MKDIQSREDERNISIKKVGIKKFHLPFFIMEKSGEYQQVLANISLSVDLPPKFKGTHLSRFVEILNKWSKKNISSNQLKEILQETQSRLRSNHAEIIIKFKYFIEKRTPVTDKSCFMDYDCDFIGTLDKDDYRFILGVKVPVHSLCPCSKEISAHGAHNQRGIIKARLYYSGDILWIEDVVKMLENEGSCPIYPLLKREDEKYVTETAYSNPKFVEDILRDVIISLRKNKNIKWFSVECEDFESIHNHSAFAFQEETEK